MSSISQDESLSPKDRLRDLQLHAPELFEHVSVKGLKRLIAQVKRSGSVVRIEPRRLERYQVSIDPVQGFVAGLGSTPARRSAWLLREKSRLHKILGLQSRE